MYGGDDLRPHVRGPHPRGRFTHRGELHVDVLGGAAGLHDEPYDAHATYVLRGARLAIDGVKGAFRYALHGQFVDGRMTRVTDTYDTYGVAHDRHRGFAIGGSFGVEARLFRMDIGFVASRTATEAGRNQFDIPLLAYRRITIGPRGRAAFTQQAGSIDGFLLDARMMDFGVYLERARVRARAAIGFGRILLPDLAGNPSWDDGTHLRTRRTDGDVDVLVDVEVRTTLTEHLALELWLQAGSQRPRGRLGLAVTL